MEEAIKILQERLDFLERVLESYEEDWKDGPIEGYYNEEELRDEYSYKIEEVFHLINVLKSNTFGSSN